VGKNRGIGSKTSNMRQFIEKLQRIVLGLSAFWLYWPTVAAFHCCSGTRPGSKASPGHPLQSASPSAKYH